MRQTDAVALPVEGKARRVYLQLRDEIANGRVRDGDILPGESRMAEVYGVSRVTVRRALGALVSDGVIEKRVGSGSVVTSRASPEPLVAADMATLIPQIVEMGRRTEARLLSFSYGEAPGHVARALDLPPPARVQNAVRVRLAEGQAFSRLTTCVPEAIARNYSEADLATTPLYLLLERGGARIETAVQKVSATLASPDAAAALGVADGSPLLSVTRVVRDAEGRGVEHLSALYRPDLFQLEMSLHRVGAGEARHWEPVIGAENEETVP